MRKIFNDCLNILLHPATHAKLVLTISMVVFVPLTYLFVYYTGGIKFVYSHTMYIPIVVLAIIYGARGGLLAGLIGGILLGPLMAIDVDTGEQQDLMNWLYRLLIFMVIGGTVGLFAKRLRYQADEITKLALENPETKLPIFTAINPLLSDENYINTFQKDVYVMAIVNGTQIIELLGKNFYNKLLMNASENLRFNFGKQLDIYQMDTTRIVMMVKNTYQEDFKENLMKYFDSAFTIDGIPIHLAIVLGVSSKNTSSTIFEKAEEAILATNTAKTNHVQLARFAKDSMPSTVDLAIVGGFKKAIEDGELYLVYQPVHDITDDRVISVESLIRWNHPTYGQMMPAKFLYLIENTQLINYLSEFVIIESFEMLKKLDDDVSVSVNLSANNFYSRFFVNKILNYITNHDCDNKRMIFEITETILMEHPKKSVEIMNKFIAKGIRFVIDDFGTGYSSLAYINMFPISYLKIDRSFIQQINDGNVYKIIKSTINLAHELGLKVVAEGVEKNTDIKKLEQLSCDFIQGFSKSIPLKENEILLYIKQNNHTKNQ